jgi:preprotein translocase subunit SecE
VCTNEECFVAKKEEKQLARRQTNFFERTIQSVRQYFKETIGELRKVSWPTRKEATNLTIIVLTVTIVMSLILGALDFIFTQFFARLFA